MIIIKHNWLLPFFFLMVLCKRLEDRTENNIGMGVFSYTGKHLTKTSNPPEIQLWSFEHHR